ncbi:methyl-accepting chemotaxis protein [Enterovibrio sp. ZSDZ35]|uniref:Methyl-accepting chemotaxis protein n=1 Tax=Enterovibrio qingdaonensis TaxID=2899818 RepID=A0ABT5QL49_9GAMM|nr:methyl-accepting chemotaxis protein [Enterovibrio sp. ZSDZ35]MDD1781691.1 methyl-accepting chemotaxis protein [Enterovibrio sp. ZSDZ35]
MSQMIFKPWEKAICNIKLVPKLVLLMVFSTLLLSAKQLWDANTFRDSVTQVTESNSRSLAIRSAELSLTLLAQPEGQALLSQVLNAENATSADDDYVFVVNTVSGDVLGHPRITSFDELSLPLENGKVLSDQLRSERGEFIYHLQSEDRHGIVVPVAGTDWVSIASQPDSAASHYYQAYLKQVIWQTLVMIAAFMVILLGASSMMLRQINCLIDGIRNMAGKNLSVPILMDCRDEFGEIASELEKTRVQLVGVIKAQRSSSEELSEIAEVMTISMDETRESAKEQFDEIDHLASAMSEMSSTVQEVAGHARAASQATESSRTQAIAGQQYVANTIGTINKLSQDIRDSAGVVNQVEERVDKISSVVVTIQGISEQTNLLALNAAIEAARAGEAGRGFAVVADEVRNLAQNTQKATVEIQDMITQLQSSAQQAVGLMEQSVIEAVESVESVSKAGDELNLIVEQIDQINDMNFHIASAAEQQASVADEMNANLTNVREIVQASVMVVTELAETSGSMQNNAAELDLKIKEFAV